MSHRIGLMLALLMLAALACSVEFSTAHLDNAGTYKDPLRQTKTRAFLPLDIVFCIVDLADADKTALPVELVLKQIVVNPDQTQDEVELDRQERHSRSDTLIFALTPPGGEWSKGNYKITLYLEDDPKFTLEFRIK
jgi:hypothetical protein